MSLISKFQEASIKKKAAIVALLGINGITMASSGMHAYNISQEPPYTPESCSALCTIMTPVVLPLLMTSGQWILSKEAAGSAVGSTPVSFIANQTKKVLPKAPDAAVGIAFTIAGAPGTWVGYGGGAIIGLAAKVKSTFWPTPTL